MRHRMPTLRPAKMLVGLVTGLLLASAAYGQLIVTEKEIERQSRTQWLLMKRHTPLAPSPRIQAYVECVTNRIIDVLDPSFGDLSWEVVVFDDDAINAFAMPGGKVGVFTGIFRVADTPDALAAVLGHEIAHLTSDHVIERARRQAGSSLVGILGGAATGMRGASQDAANIFLSLPFSRKRMAEERGGETPTEFLSTHPSDDRRLDDLVKSLTPALIEYNAAREAGRIPNCGT